jgi:hypothetical protein
MAWDIALCERFFHWFLEFPEIIVHGGFDCILGNPPYLGGDAPRRSRREPCRVFSIRRLHARARGGTGRRVDPRSSVIIVNHRDAARARPAPY